VGYYIAGIFEKAILSEQKKNNINLKNFNLNKKTKIL